MRTHIGILLFCQVSKGHSTHPRPCLYCPFSALRNIPFVVSQTHNRAIVSPRKIYDILDLSHRIFQQKENPTMVCYYCDGSC